MVEGESSWLGERDLLEAVESSGIGIWTWEACSGRIRWSRVASELLGAAPNDDPLSLDRWVEFIHAEDRARFVRSWRTFLDAPEATNLSIEYRANRTDAEMWVWATGHAERSADGRAVKIRGSIADISIRKQKERALSESEERVRLFAEHATDYVYDARFEGSTPVPTIVAGSFERTVGYTPEEVVAKGGWFEVIHPDDRERMLYSTEPLTRGQALTCEYRIVDRSGATRWLRDRIVPILGDDGHLERMVGGVTDITEQRLLQERLAHSEKMEAVARLAGGVAHDFNNLLTILMGECDLLNEPSLDASARTQCVSDIQSTLVRAAQLTSSLLAFGKNPQGPLEVIDLRRVVEVNERVLRSSLPSNIRLLCSIPDEPMLVSGHESDVQRILVNLVFNARDVMKEGTIALSMGKVHLDEHSASARDVRPGEYAELRVQDSGGGIAEGVRGRVFEPYFTTKGSQGNGLGLSSSFGAARRQGGHLEVESTGSSGTTFLLLLPMAASSTETRWSNAPRPQPPVRLLVAVIEDEALVRGVLVRTLRGLDHETFAFGSAEDYLASSLASMDSLDLIVTDVGLPGLDGLELVAELLRRGTRARLLVVSGLVESVRSDELIASGKIAFLQKPFSRTQLIETLSRVFAEPA